MVDQQQVMEKLKTVIDPELNIDIVGLGLVYGVFVSMVESVPHVHIVMTLTTPGCPLIAVFDQKIREAIAELGITADAIEIELTFDPPWTPELMSQEAKLALGYE